MSKKPLTEVSDEELLELAKRASTLLQQITEEYNKIRQEVHKRKAKEKAASLVSKLTPAERAAVFQNLGEQKDGGGRDTNLGTSSSKGKTS